MKKIIYQFQQSRCNLYTTFPASVATKEVEVPQKLYEEWVCALVAYDSVQREMQKFWELSENNK